MILQELKKYAEKQAEYHDEEARITDDKLDEEYHLGQRDAYATIASIIDSGINK